MMHNPMLPVDHIRRTEIPTSLQQAKVLDFVWMFECTFNPNHTPMWTGWNSQRFQNETDSKQKVFYLSQINQSPTSVAVVAETMKRAIQIADECSKENIAVTYGS